MKKQELSARQQIELLLQNIVKKDNDLDGILELVLMANFSKDEVFINKLKEYFVDKFGKDVVDKVLIAPDRNKLMFLLACREELVELSSEEFTAIRYLYSPF